MTVGSNDRSKLLILYEAWGETPKGSNAGTEVRRPSIAVVMILLHGTTRARAETIVRDGPDPNFAEPGGRVLARGFSMTVEAGPFHFGAPEDYARGKAREFPDERGPVILSVDVPDDILRRAVNEWFPLSQGLIQFDFGAGLEDLMAAWPALAKEIRGVTHDSGS